jgi:glutathione S-transferase
VLRKKKVPFELGAADVMAGAHKKPEYLVKQPFGQIPYIVRISVASIGYQVLISPISISDIDRFILYESRAICRHIATKYANQRHAGAHPDALEGERAVRAGGVYCSITLTRMRARVSLRSLSSHKSIQVAAVRS